MYQFLARQPVDTGSLLQCGEQGLHLSVATHEGRQTHPARGPATSPELSPIRVWTRTASVSYGKATTYLPVIDLLKSYSQIEPRDDTRKIREKIVEKLLSLDRSLEGCLMSLLWLLDVPAEDPEWERMDPSLRRQRLHEGLCRLLLRESQVQPVMLVLEDLQWMDGETQALLDVVVESLPTARVFVLVNYRPEYRQGWASKTLPFGARIRALL